MHIRELAIRMKEYLNSSNDTFFFGRGNVRLFPEVSAGVQPASHEIFGIFPRMIAGHRTPGDFFRHEYPGKENMDYLSVISLAFHVHHDIVRDNSREENYPAFSWYEARHNFNFMYQPVTDAMRRIFPGKRISVPLKSSLYLADLSKSVPVSNWSERHVAFACGLGTFGLHGALITEMGCTHRLISVIVDTKIEGAVEPPENHNIACRYFTDGSCGECMTRCPVGAIVPGKHVIERCYEHEWMTCRTKSREIFGTEVPACGLCMCGVPCDIENPV